MTEDDRRTAAIHKCYKAYRELQKYDTLRLHTRENVYDDVLIEVYRYSGGKKCERVFKVTQENAADAYEQAAEQLKHMLEQKQNDGKAGQHGT